MKVKNIDYPDYKTARQWAKQGYLPKEGATGIELWSNRNCVNRYVYYSPNEVAVATTRQLSEFFEPERERQRAKAKERRQIKKEENERLRKKKHQEIVNNAAKPYLARISELHKIINAVSVGKTLVIDTETTGLNPETDELLQVSIIDSDGNTLFDSYFKPCAKSWPEAERVNGISPEMVHNAPTIPEKIAEINEIMCKADKIVGYNTNFDLDFLCNNGLILSDDAEIVDVMEMFAEEYGEWDEKYNCYKWKKLSVAADYYSYNWNSRPEGAHNSLADCYATLYVYQNLI